MSKFYDIIKEAKIERQVEDAYNKGIETYFPNCPISYPHSCDGIIDTKTEKDEKLKLLMEFKYNVELSSKVARAKVIIQTIFYLKRFEIKGEQLPNVILIGDINECFVLHANNVIKYLDEDVNWDISPSTAYQKYPDLVLKISEDDDINLNVFIFDIDDNFKFKDVANKIIDSANNVHRFIHITEHNIEPIFESFCKKVIKSPKKIPTNDLVALFIGVISESDNYYKHPTKKNTLVTPIDTVSINGDAFDSFFKYFGREYSPQEKNKFAAISDRLIEDTNRRNKGEFYTPTIWVDYAHKMIAEQLGENWRTEYTVWDCCCGTKNLTRDYYFGDLYCSTLENAELRISSKYNKEATSFQFDFLNDELDKLPEGLLNAFKENKKILFFINPPYATAGNYKNGTKKDVAKTKMNEEMLQNNYGACSQNLYAQFLYRIQKIKDIYDLKNLFIGIFSPTLFLTGTSYKNFRANFLNTFKYLYGFQLQASHFSNVSANWGISFTCWIPGKTHNTSEFLIDVCDVSDDVIKVILNKKLYNIDFDKTGSDYIKCPIKATEDMPHLSSGVTIKGTTGKGILNSLGYLFSKSNNVDLNTQNVALFTAVYSDGHGQNIIKENFIPCITLFSARRLILPTWINWTDEYIVPNEQHPLFKEFTNDSIIYSLFESKSNQSSLRQIEYKEKLWDIKNEFFFLPKSRIMELANNNDNDFCYNDARVSEERYVAKLLFNDGLYDNLSEEARNVLDKAIELTEKSFKYRKLFDEEHPEYQINNWDCGWYQIKAVLKEYLPDEYKEFQELFKELGNKMRPMVYELGFLK